MSININLIEGDYDDVSEEEYQEIKKDYLGYDLTVQQIRSKYGISNNKWKRIRNRITDETGFQRNHRTRGGIKNYHQSRYGTYVVQKGIDGRQYTYGTFKTEREAQQAVELLIECDWDLNKRNEIIKKIKGE